MADDTNQLDQDSTKTDKQGVDLFQKARTVFSGDAAPKTDQQSAQNFSTDHLIPLDEVKQLGIYTEVERPQLVALFEFLTKLIDSKYQLVDGQKVIVKLLQRGVVELTTEGKQLYSAVPEQERQQRLFLADLIQLTSDIGRTLWRWDHSEHLKEFGSIEGHYWLKELGIESNGQISGIFDKEKIAKLQRELFADIWIAIKEHEPKKPESAGGAPTKDISTAVVDADAIAAAVASHATGSGQAAEAGTDADDQTTDQKLERADDFQQFLQTHTRELQIERQNLLAMLEFELYNNFKGDFSSAELDQIWEDLSAQLNEELYQFLISNPDLTTRLLSRSAGDSGALQEVFAAFLPTIGAKTNLTQGFVELYKKLGEELAKKSPQRAEALAKQLENTTIAGVTLIELLEELPAQEALSSIRQDAAIQAIPTDPPPTTVASKTPSTSPDLTESESQLQQTAAEYLSTHAEYEIFKKTRIFLQLLPPDLDLAAQNIRLELVQLARTYALGLTSTQLRFLQNDPSYAAAFYQRFLLDIQRTQPQISTFLSNFGAHIRQIDSAEAAQFELMARKGIFVPQIGKDALATGLTSSLGGAATPVVVGNAAITIDAMILNHGADTPDFVSKISTDRLELTFGLAAGTLTADTAPLFLATLKNQIDLRLHDLKLTGGQQFLDTGGLQAGYTPTTPETVEQAVGAIPQSRLIIAQHSAEIVVAAQGPATPPVGKDHEAWWSSLPKEIQIQLYTKLQGGAAAAEMIGFGSLPIPNKLLSLSSTEVRKLLVGLAEDSPKTYNAVLKEVDENLLIEERIEIQQQKVAEFRRIVFDAILHDIQEERAQQIAAHLGLVVAAEQTAQSAIAAAVSAGQAGSSPVSAVTPQQIMAMDEALSVGGENALVGQNTASQSFLQQFAGAGKSRFKDAMRRRLGQQVRKKLASKVAGGAATKALGALGGPAIAIGLTILQNKTARQIAAGTVGLAVANTAYALTTVGGMVGAAIGGFIGAGLGGPVGGLFGGVVGANIGAGIFPAQWTNPLGWSPSSPASASTYFGGGESSVGGSSLGTASSLREMRAAESGATTSQQAAGTNQAAVNAGNTSVSFQNNPAATTATSSPLTSILGATTATIVATAAPLLGIGIGLFLSLQVLFIIYAAFLVQVPSEGVAGVSESQSKYVTLTKEADITTVSKEEDTPPTPVTYAISLAPKDVYSIQVTQVTDTFSYIGGDTLSLKSPLSINNFSTEVSSEPQDTTYTITIDSVGIDAMVVNSLTITFDVFDSEGTKITTGETVTALAAIIVGNPEVGCFNPGAAGKFFPTKDDGATSQTWNSKNWTSLLTSYAKYAQSSTKLTALLCSKGEITLYSLGSHASYFGWAMSTNEVGFYSGTFNNTISTEYTLMHELGHTIDYRNSGLRQQFTSQLPQGLYNCFDYPIVSRCNSSKGGIESFAEAITLYATNYKGYDLKSKHPREYAWLKTNIFGGSEY